MKYLRMCTFIVLTSLLAFSNVNGQSNKISNDANPSYEGLAISKIERQQINKESDAILITVKDFSGLDKLPQGFGLNGLVFSDDGMYNDIKANDGIYTSTESSKIERSRQGVIYNELIVSKEFDESLIVSSSKVKIGCKFERCGCPCAGGASCPACNWHGWDCWEIVQCEISVEF